MVKTYITLLLILLSFTACKQSTPKTEEAEIPEVPKEPTNAELEKELTEKGYKVFEMVDDHGHESVLMQQYYIAFLKSGPNQSDNQAEIDSLQALHMEHLQRMYDEGYADISGPFADDGEIRGITIYNTPNQQFADSLANLDPMVKAGRLVIEIHPWWAGKGFPLR